MMTGRCLVPLLLAVAAVRLAAQVYERPLTGQDLDRLIPVLQADRRDTAALARAAERRDILARSRAQARQAAATEIANGADPLQWLIHHSPHAVAPSTAVYQAACSRALTQSSSAPAAVLSFGVAAPPAWLAVWKQRDQTLPVGPAPPSGQQRGQARTPRAEQLTQQARAFYSDRRFEYQGEPAPFEWQFLAPDRLVSATVMGVNVIASQSACGALASGPMVVLRGENELFGKTPAAPEKPDKGGHELDGALQKAGLTDADYLNLKLQLLNARADARDPSRLDLPANATDEQRRALTFRRQDAQFYRAHQKALDPLLEGLSPTLPGR